MAHPLQNHLVKIFASGFYTGYMPVASGTFGSLVGVALYLAAYSLPTFLQWILAVALTGFAVWMASLAAPLFGEVDSSKIVIDEVAGMFITLIGVPPSLYWIVIGFLIFRALDIVKPPPAHWFDKRVKNGWGVVLDDVAAGFYGNIILLLMTRASGWATT